MTLEIRAFIHGGDDTLCEVLMRREVPQPAQNNFALLDGWAQKSTVAIGMDMKHTQRWRCEVCGARARETWFDPRPSLRLSDPLVIVHIHHLCEAGGGPCHTEVETRAYELAIETGGVPPAPSLRLPIPDGPPIPFSGSCVKCQRDATADPGFAISRCSKCKLTRYCSVECQKEDWPRHGKICKTIRNVQWFNWDEDVTTESASDESLKMPGAFV